MGRGDGTFGTQAIYTVKRFDHALDRDLVIAAVRLLLESFSSCPASVASQIFMKWVLTRIEIYIRLMYAMLVFVTGEGDRRCVDGVVFTLRE